jgi:hypothetical protein
MTLARLPAFLGLRLRRMVLPDVDPTPAAAVVCRMAPWCLRCLAAAVEVVEVCHYPRCPVAVGEAVVRRPRLAAAVGVAEVR